MKSCFRQTFSQSHRPWNHNSPQALGNGHPQHPPPTPPRRVPHRGFTLLLPTPHQSLIDPEALALAMTRFKKLGRALPSCEGRLTLRRHPLFYHHRPSTLLPGICWGAAEREQSVSLFRDTTPRALWTPSVIRPPTRSHSPRPPQCGCVCKGLPGAGSNKQSQRAEMQGLITPFMDFPGLRVLAPSSCPGLCRGRYWQRIGWAFAS